MPIDIVVMKAVNAENAEKAAQVRRQLDQLGILGLNIMSSPGSGKTSLLEATLQRLAGGLRLAVIEGDVYTALDAERIARFGVPVVQINTQGSCHMTAHMVVEVLPQLRLDGVDILVIENIGNLICPASFELGEQRRAALLSTAEGADKLEKYPKLFSISHVNLLTKADLAPYVDFDLADAQRRLRLINPEAPALITSARSGLGLDGWCAWLDRALAEVRNGHAA